MKISLFIRTLFIVISMSFVFQSCAIYRAQDATLDEAVESKNRVKVVDKNHQKEKSSIIV